MPTSPFMIMFPVTYLFGPLIIERYLVVSGDTPCAKGAKTSPVSLCTPSRVCVRVSLTAHAGTRVSINSLTPAPEVNGEYLSAAAD